MPAAADNNTAAPSAKFSTALLTVSLSARMTIVPRSRNEGDEAMTITMPHFVTGLTHWRAHHPKRVKSDWDIHGHPHHQQFIESALMAREMKRL
ncbi:hypothetical protein FIV07_02900 [Mycobacterium sp. THAF192]|nr:hypothetical protein FIV07_02900 [Mycobacterium sp. THAF192]